MIIKILYWIAASGWILHLLYWILRRRQNKKGLLSGDDLLDALFPDYVLSVSLLIMLCVLGIYGVYLGG